MARLRPIQTGHLYERGPSWFIQWREDIRTEAGAVERRRFTKRICPTVDAEGGRITQREAERIAYEEILCRLNAEAIFPVSLMTMAEYWAARFEPEHIDNLKAAGRRHYKWAKPRILAGIGNLTLREARFSDVQTFIDRTRAEAAAAGRPLQPQTLLHLKNAISALFRHAIARGYRQAANPATGVRVPPMRRKARVVLSFAQAEILIGALKEPTRTLCYLSMLTSLNVAEMAALRRRHVNLTDSPAIMTDGRILPPQSLMVEENYYEGEYSTTKTRARRRLVPLTARLVKMLAGRLAAAKNSSPEAPLFQNREGKPIDAHNLAGRHLRPTAEKVLGLAGIGWHTFRRCAATFADWVQMPLSERVAMMGHASAAMTLHYTAADMERRRPYLSEVERLIETSADPNPQPTN